MRDQFDAVVLVRIVGGGDHDARGEWSGSRQIRDAWRGGDASKIRRHLLPREAARHFGSQPGTRLTSVHSDNDLRLLPGFQDQFPERRAYRVGSFRI